MGSKVRIRDRFKETTITLYKSKVCVMPNQTETENTVLSIYVDLSLYTSNPNIFLTGNKSCFAKSCKLDLQTDL